MRVLGIDPGLATTGYGIIELSASHNLIGTKCHGVPSQRSAQLNTQSASHGTDRHYALIEAGIITTKPDEPTPKRLRTIYIEVEKLIDEFKPDAMAVEQVFFSKNSKTAMAVSQARGVILLAGYNLPVESYTPLQVKLQIVGYGRAGKAQIQSMIASLLNLKEIPKPDDAADALAVALCHILKEQAHVRVRQAR